MGKWVAFLAILTASLVVVWQAQVHAAPEGAKAGDECAVSVDGDGNVYIDRYEDRNGRLVCMPSSKPVTQTKDEAVDKVFPTAVINNPISDATPRTTRPQPTPVSGCSAVEILHAGTDKEYGHVHLVKDQSNSLTAKMDREAQCKHRIHHRKTWTDEAPTPHNHLLGESGGVVHEHE